MKSVSQVLLLSLVTLSFVLTSSFVFSPIRSTTASNYFKTADMLPHPWMETPSLGLAPDFFVEGDSDEFTHGHITYSDDDGVVVCNWTHEAGTELDFSGPTDPEKPDCRDFLYFSYTLEWPYEEMPKNADITTIFSITTTGTFAVDEWAGLMFRVYVWLIDSSNNWRMIYESSPPYSESFRDREINLNYFDISAVWDGMVEDEDGNQDDPADTFQIAVGLAPTSEFQSFGDSHPWEYYEGTVSLRVDYLELVVWGDFGTDLIREMPVYNESIAVQEDHYHIRDIAASPNGEFYIASDFLDSDTSNRTISVMRFRSDCIQNWRTDESTYGSSIAAGIACDSIGNLYLIGTRFGSGSGKSLLVMKWNAAGVLEWGTNQEHSSSGDWRAVDIDSGGDDEIYSIAEFVAYNGSGTPYTTATIQKWTADGQLVWNRQVLPGPDIFPVDLEVIQEDGVYVLCLFGNQTTPMVVKLDMSGNTIWTVEDTFRTISARRAGGIYAVTKSSDSARIQVHEIGFDGASESSTFVPFLVYQDVFVSSWGEMTIAEAHDGSIAFLGIADRLWGYHSLMRFDAYLNHVWAEILDEIHDDCWNQPAFLTVGSNGLAYVVGSTSFSEKIIVAAYEFTNRSPEGGLLPIQVDLGLIVTLSSLGVIGVVTVLVVRSRQNV